MQAFSFLGEVALPHYQAVADIVAREIGLAPSTVQQTPLADLRAAAAAGPAMAFLCGLPYVRLHDAGGDVEALAAPVARGRQAATYDSVLVARAGLAGLAPAALAGRRVGFNDEDSLSGWVMPRAFMRRAGVVVDGFDWVRTGSHHASLDALLAGGIDAAPIDSGVLTLEARARPRIAALPVLANLGPLPAPPVVAFSCGRAETVRDVLCQLGELPGGRAALGLGGIERYVPAEDSAYDPVRAVVADEAAAARGPNVEPSARPR